MMKIIDINDVKLHGRTRTVIRRFYIGSSLILGATLLGATIAAGFAATTVKISLAIMTIPAYVYFFLSRFCHRIEIRPEEETICFHRVLHRHPVCAGIADIVSIRKKVLQEQRVLYQLRVGRSKYTICATRQGALEKLFPERFTPPDLQPPAKR